MDGNGSEPPPRSRRPALTRIPATLVLALVAGVLAALVYLIAVSGPGSQVAVAARRIDAGEAVGPAHFRFVEIRASDVVLSTMVGPETLRHLRGQVATRAIAAGAVVSRADFAPPAAAGGLRAMSLPVDQEHAVGGALRPGDRVDLIDGAARPDPLYVAADAEVLAVAAPAGSGLGGTRRHSITVAVDPWAALRVAAAIEGGKLEVVRATGAVPIPLGTAQPTPAGR